MSGEQRVRRGNPEVGTTADRPDAVSRRVRRLTRDLGGLLNLYDAGRVVVGLIYMKSRASRAQDGPDGRREAEKPSWPSLVRRAEDQQPLSPYVRYCLSQWLPRTDESDGADAGGESVPYLPRTADTVLRYLVKAIDQAVRRGELLEQCLQDLSSAQAKGGHYFTPPDIVRLMVAAAAPQDGQSVLDPVCGSAGLLIEAARQVSESLGGLHSSLALTGQDLHAGTLQIARMNLSAHGLDGHIGPAVNSLEKPSDSFYDIVLANPPFNMSFRGAETPRRGDPRWPDDALPPRDNANFAWILHIAHALDSEGRAAILMADGAATGVRPVEQKIRKRLVRSDLVECVIALPPGLFPHTRISSCLWLLNRDKGPQRGQGRSDRRSQVLLIDARGAYETVPDTRQRRLGSDGTERILRTLAAWRGAPPATGQTQASYQDEPGWCRSLSLQEIADHQYDLLPPLYTSESADEAITEDGRVAALVEELQARFEESHRLETDLLRVLGEL
ncbi:N-6 DNA methylase [Streptomyces nanhaiensis]|uniref:N-6 DNA methylase n=1 Tax=Streptomyces nanhaiensis TaxID=679319 RepID=UPI00399C868B